MNEKRCNGCEKVHSHWHWHCLECPLLTRNRHFHRNGVTIDKFISFNCLRDDCVCDDVKDDRILKKHFTYEDIVSE